jgi:hypothetical protein
MNSLHEFVILLQILSFLIILNHLNDLKLDLKDNLRNPMSISQIQKFAEIRQSHDLNSLHTIVVFLQILSFLIILN